MKSKMFVGAVLLLVSSSPFAGGNSEELTTLIRSDFRSKGIAKLERLNQDSLQVVCSGSRTDQLSEDMVDSMQQQQRSAIKYPADGTYLGDWKRGESIAQNGRGFTWSDQANIEVGGNCYNCHQLSPKEISYGTLGPSLSRYGKRRGMSPSVQKDTFATIYNAKAYNLCSAMPRFGHIGALTEQQIKDLVALLLDPESPVNQ